MITTQHLVGLNHATGHADQIQAWSDWENLQQRITYDMWNHNVLDVWTPLQ